MLYHFKFELSLICKLEIQKQRTDVLISQPKGNTSLQFLQMMWIELSSLFRPRLYCMDSSGNSHCPRDFRLRSLLPVYMKLSLAFACCIYFLILRNGDLEVCGYDSNNSAPYLASGYIYDQSLGNPVNSHSKRTLP